MKFVRYTILLVLIALAEMFLNLSSAYTFEILYIIAFVSSLHTTSRNAVIAFFIAGVIADLFTSDQLGLCTFLYTSTGILHIYFRNALHSKSGLLQLFFLAISLTYILFMRSILQNYSLSTEAVSIVIANNLLLSILVAPTVAVIIELPLICPWQRKKFAY